MDLSDDALCFLPASSLTELFRTGVVSPLRALEAQITRIEATGESVNAVTGRQYESARHEAAEAERRYAAGTERPLEGLTVAAKEEQPIDGEPLRLGSIAWGGEVSDHSHPIIERIREAGGIIHVRTTTPEYCAAGFTQSSLWGVTRNPWNHHYSSGGSSGGTGAALATGLATLGTGSDIAGSIRIPAAFNGVVGYMAPYAVVPSLPPTNLDMYCRDGAMARTVRDAVTLHNVIAGRHRQDMASLPKREVLDPGHHLAELNGLTVAVSPTLGDYPVGRDVAEGMGRAVEALEAAGAHIVNVEFDWSMDEITRAAFAHYGTIMAPMIRHELGDAYPEAESYTRDFVETSERALAELGTYRALNVAVQIQSDLAKVFSTADALVCPSSVVPALRADHDYTDHVVDVDGAQHTLVHHLQVPLTIPFNMASRVPAFAVPTGIAPHGVPTSAQIVGRPYDESTAALVATAVETALPWFVDEAWRPTL